MLQKSPLLQWPARAQFFPNKLICRGPDPINLTHWFLGQVDPRIPAGRYHESSAVGDSTIWRPAKLAVQ